MPRSRKPPRLAIRTEEDGRKVWVIRDGKRYVRTGSSEDQIGDAEQSLQEYLAHKSKQPDTSHRVASQVTIADTLMLYVGATEAKVARPAELRARCRNLNEFWGTRKVNEVIGPTCREYVAQRGAPIAARRELETMRAAIKLYKKEHGLDVVPEFDLPEQGEGRQRWLTRSEAAALLLTTLGFVKDGETKRWTRHKGMKREHLARFILIGLYTGTRHKAILGLQWRANTTGGWVDLERGVLYRRGEGEKETKKRRTPVKMSPRLQMHLRRWRRMDDGQGFVVRYAPRKRVTMLKSGRPASGGVTRIEKAFRGARKAALLSDDVTPHVLRHTRATWLMQKATPLNEAAQSLGMTIKMLEDRYWHHHPDYQKNAAEAY